MKLATRGIRIALSLGVLCVFAAAGSVRAGGPDQGLTGTSTDGAPVLDIAGRWQGLSHVVGRRAEACSGNRCVLTLDIVRCQGGWCGVEVVGPSQRCGPMALRLDGGEANGASRVFKGNLELAQGSEPYVVEVYFVAAGGDDVRPELQIVGDTGGEFRMFRRTFPFNVTMVRSGDASCRPVMAVSALE